MKIYIARHGQTDWNVRHEVCGITDAQLTEEGLAQAEQLAESCIGKDIEIIISSPLTRAVKTAEAVANKLGKKVIVDNRLIEMDYGTMEGIDWDNLEYLEAKKQFVQVFPEGESIMQVAYRAYSLLDDVIEQYSGKNVLLVCHGSISRIMNTYFESMTNEQFFKYLLKNCELKEYEVQ